MESIIPVSDLPRYHVEVRKSITEFTIPSENADIELGLKKSKKRLIIQVRVHQKQRK
jgi:hypothetical protein